MGGAADADRILLLTEAHRGLTDGAAIIDQFREHAGTPALVINKIDRRQIRGLLALSQQVQRQFKILPAPS